MKLLATGSLSLAFLWSSVAVEIESITRTSEAISMTWRAEDGRTYRVESSANLQAPWERRATLAPETTVMTWQDVDTGGVPQRFYRIVEQADTPNADPYFLATDAVPGEIGSAFTQSRQTASDAISLASQLAGLGTLVTTGTLREQPDQSWNYDASPEDRLVAFPRNGGAVIYEIQRLNGDLSVSAAHFLDNNHDFAWRVDSEGIGDLTFTSIRNGKLVQATSLGTFDFQGTVFGIDLGSTTDHYFESSFGGTHTITDTSTTGTITAQAFLLNVQKRQRFELITSPAKSASTNEEWLGHTLTLGSDIYKWQDVKKQKSFSDGRPSQVNSYWDSLGAVFKNGAGFGFYQKRLEAMPGGTLVKFVIALPDRVIDVETWPIFN